MKNEEDLSSITKCNKYPNHEDFYIYSDNVRYLVFHFSKYTIYNNNTSNNYNYNYNNNYNYNDDGNDNDNDNDNDSTKNNCGSSYGDDDGIVSGIDNLNTNDNVDSIISKINNLNLNINDNNNSISCDYISASTN